MNAQAETLDIEALFNSVELGLKWRWMEGHVPPVFARLPWTWLQKTVKAWWEIYHESVAARNSFTRIVRVRPEGHPAEALDNLAFVTALEEIQARLDMEALHEWRASPSHEEAAVALLAHLVDYYH